MKLNPPSLILSFLVLQNAAVATAQSYSGCHSHGDVEYCYGPNGEETPMTAVDTIAPTTSTRVSQISPAGITSPARLPPGPTTTFQVTVVTDCHKHSTQTFCIMENGEEVQVTGTRTGEPAAQYTGCHSHGKDQYCLGPEGEEVQILAEGTSTTESHDDDEDGNEEHSQEENCHFHAGVEHCVGGSESGSSHSSSCERKDREYNIPLRIGSLFVILVSSSIAVFGPILFSRFFHARMNGVVFTVIKQFGTGVMISTAFVHLLTHAQLMFTNECLGELSYEATTTAVVTAGLFLCFLVEYSGNRFIISRGQAAAQNGGPDTEPTRIDKSQSATAMEPAQGPSLTTLGHHHHGLSRPDDKLSVLVMEAGIIFHSVLIGLTLVVAGDSGYASLFIVIIFHQMFEGLALGARIAALVKTKTVNKLLMGTVFALITPIGMAIGLGVIHTFNGNERNTILTIATLDAISAGILIWVALVDMWSHDWLYGDLKDSGIVKTSVGLLSLVTGMILMAVLGKWA